MRWQSVLRTIVGLVVAMGVPGTLVWSQGGIEQVETQAASQFLAPATQVVAVRAGRLFDATSGTILTNQVVLIEGDRIADVGPAVEMPPGATVLPGMIDTHVHPFGILATVPLAGGRAPDRLVVCPPGTLRGSPGVIPACLRSSRAAAFALALASATDTTAAQQPAPELRRRVLRRPEAGRGWRSVRVGRVPEVE